jgi:hypothetical protein
VPVAVNRCKEASVPQKNTLDFVEVVILRGQPENRDSINFQSEWLFPFHHRERLKHREQRPTKQTNLLPSYNHRGARFQA